MGAKNDRSNAIVLGIVILIERQDQHAVVAHRPVGVGVEVGS